MIQFIAGVIVGAFGMFGCWIFCAAAGRGSQMKKLYYKEEEMSYEKLEKNFTDLKVNLDWNPYIFPFHSITLRESFHEDYIGCLDCKMFLQDKSMYLETVLIDGVLPPEAIHELIGQKVKVAIEYLIRCNRLSDEKVKELIE